MKDIFKYILLIVKRYKSIPEGYYCHFTAFDRVCPFWSKDAKHHKSQENGYCYLLGKGDYDLNREVVGNGWVEVKQPDGSYKRTDYKNVTSAQLHKLANLPSEGGSLLWDMCKECGLKMNRPR